MPAAGLPLVQLTPADGLAAIAAAAAAEAAAEPAGAAEGGLDVEPGGFSALLEDADAEPAEPVPPPRQEGVEEAEAATDGPTVGEQQAEGVAPEDLAMAAVEAPEAAAAIDQQPAAVQVPVPEHPPPDPPVAGAGEGDPTALPPTADP